jgi:hypothetical protein
MILTNTPQKIIWLLKSGTKNKVTLTQVGVVVDVVIRLEPLEKCLKKRHGNCIILTVLRKLVETLPKWF